jgi:hypothetical protein
MSDLENEEHIFTDKQAFMAEVTKNGLWPINTAIFQKRGDILNGNNS